MSKTGKSIKTENRFVAARGWGKEKIKDWGLTVNGYKFPFVGDENVLELDTGDVCTTL